MSLCIRASAPLPYSIVSRATLGATVTVLASWSGSSKTVLVLRRPLLIVVRRLVAQRRVPALPVVESLNEVEDGPPRLARVPEPVTVQQLALQRRKEALAQGVVVGVPHGAHRRPHSRLLASFPEGGRGVLRPLVPKGLWVAHKGQVPRTVRSILAVSQRESFSHFARQRILLSPGLGYNEPYSPPHSHELRIRREPMLRGLWIIFVCSGSVMGMGTQLSPKNLGGPTSSGGRKAD